MDPNLICGLLSLGLNTTLQVLSAQGVTKHDYTPLACSLEGAFTPVIGMIPAWIEGKQPPSAESDVLAAFATAIGVLNALKSQPGLPKDMLTKIDEYICAGQDGTTAYLAASKGFDLSLFAPVQPMPC